MPVASLLAIALVGVVGGLLPALPLAVAYGLMRAPPVVPAALVVASTASALETLGELCCDLISACDQTGDVDRLRQWNRLLDEATRERRELPVMTFCGCCSAETLIGISLMKCWVTRWRGKS